MKQINKIMLIAAGFALSIGGCIASSSSKTIGKANAANVTYTLVTQAPTDWSGEYLITNPNGTKAFDGSATSTETVFDVSSDGSKIVGDYSNKTVTFASVEGGYSIKTASQKYISGVSGSNKVSFGNTASACTVEKIEDGVKITSNTSVLRYNSDATLIRFYKSSSWSNQQAVQLYKAGETKTASSIAVKTQPSKLSYKEGELFDPTGLELTVTYADSTVEDISEGYDWDLKEGLNSSDTTVTISYLEKTTTVSITVAALESLSYEGTLSKTTYNAGEKFDTTGITVYANYVGGEKVDVTSSVEWAQLNKDDTSITGTYGGKSITINGLTVKAAAAFVELTDATTLKAGTQIIITNTNSTLAAGTFDAASVTKGKFLKENITVVDGMITPTENTTIFTLGNVSEAWTLSTSIGYVKFTGTSNQNMGVVLDTPGVLTNDYMFDIGPTYAINKSYSDRAIRYNADVGFTNYGKTSLDGIKIYYKSSGTIEDTITDISLTTTEKQTIDLNDTFTIGATLSCGEDANKNINWTAEDDGIVSFSSSTSESGNNITVTGIGAGSTTITATAAGDENIKETIDVEVADPNTVTEVIINDVEDITGICHVNNTKTLTAAVKPDSAVNKNVTWSSSDETVATVNASGVVTSIKPGLTQITATSVLTPSVSKTIDFIVFSQKGTKTTCPIGPSDINNGLDYNVWPQDVDTVGDQSAAAEFDGQYYVKGIVAQDPDVSKNYYSFKMVDTFGGEVFVDRLYSESTIAKGNQVMMLASFESISEVEGVDTIVKPSFESVETITVPVTGLSLTGPTSVKVGKTITLVPTYVPSYTTQVGVTWSSNDSGIASVADGVVTGVSEGSATITATSTASGSITATFDVEVTSASAIAGKYTFVSNTTTYVQPTGAMVTSYLNGFDTDVFQSDQYSNSDVRFGATGYEDKIYIGYDGAFSFGLSWDTVMDYTIAKVTFKNLKASGTDGYITSTFQGYDDTYSFSADASGSDVSFYPFSYMIASYGANGRNLTFDAIEVEVVANTDTDTLSDYFAESILNVTAKDCAALDVTTATWGYLEDEYARLNELNSAAVNEVKNATADQTGTDAEKAAARYDYILMAYGTASYANFLGRTITSSSGRFASASNTNAYIVALIVLTTILCVVGVTIVLNKKKKQD